MEKTMASLVDIDVSRKHSPTQQSTNQGAWGRSAVPLKAKQGSGREGIAEIASLAHMRARDMMSAVSPVAMTAARSNRVVPDMSSRRQTHTAAEERVICRNYDVYTNTDILAVRRYSEICQKRIDGSATR